MKKLSLLLFFFFTQNSISSMTDPYYKEVLERGYNLIPGDSVVFPDGSACRILDFNTGVCGQEWMTSDYCVGEGQPIWNKHRCCEGLEPYISSDTDGQEKCEEVSSSWFKNGTLLYFFLGVLIPLGLFVFLAFGIKRKMNQRNVRN